jgi:hypothetical protein
MKNTFEAAYQQELKIRAAYDTAEAAGSEEGKEAARTAIHELWDSIEAQGAACSRIYREYTNSRDKGNEYLDLHDVIWDRDVENLITCMRENGIERFTFSSGWSSAVETAWLFQENGCKLEGLIQINGDEDTWNDGEYKKAPAYLFSIC